MQMPKVQECDVDQCAYNTDGKCHALAITIGDGENPMCDTFCQSSSKGGVKGSTAGVGACKVTACRHNQMLECSAKRISVGWEGQQADCLTFAPK